MANAVVEFDVVLRGGRVIDPETGVDAVRDVGIRGGVIAAVCEPPLASGPGTIEVDCAGLVVSPGFIDMHSHAMDLEGARFQACDGVTTHLELEFGAWPVRRFYAARAGRHPLNYGASAGHIPARVTTLDPASEPQVEACCATPHLLSQCICASSQTHQARTGAAGAPSVPPLADPAHGASPYAAAAAALLSAAAADPVAAMRARLSEGLAEGGVGIGLGIQYVPGASHAEVFRVFQTAAAHGVPCFVHCRGEMDDIKDFTELFADAAASGAALQICHIAASCGMKCDFGLVLEMIDELNARGAADITAEQYSYCAGMTRIDSSVFSDGWQQRLGIGPERLEWCLTGERLTEETFAAYRKVGGTVIAHAIPEKWTDLAMRHPRVAIASDAIPWDGGKSHPRSAGCFSRVLARYVRERKVISLQEGLRKMTLMPAQRLQSFCPSMRRKGRLQVGCDADITVFDPATIADNATFAEPARVSSGIAHVLVGGVFVLRDGAFQEGVFPGRGIKSEVKASGAAGGGRGGGGGGGGTKRARAAEEVADK
jgi:imidazolonepropionase-like amidohydrolase